MHHKLRQVSFLLHLFLATFTCRANGDPIPTLSLEHIDPTLPPALPTQPPHCSLLVLQQDFADTVGASPASANYTHPPDCPFPWTRVVLELSIAASDLQEARVAALWLDGAEVLRTTTPLPMARGAFWRVHKDITRYAALLRRFAHGGGVVSMMLENSVNPLLPGIFSANVSFHFYRGPVDVDVGQASSLSSVPVLNAAHPSVRALYHEPADVVLPISKPDGRYGSGFWYRVENETAVEAVAVAIPRNTYRAVLEIFVSYHGDDQSWYTNPLRSDYPSGPRSNGAFRMVYATLDGRYVGGRLPFPVIHPSAINPFFWSPVAAIGAFDMPSYELDLTPFLGVMLDGRPHRVGLGVRGGQPHWLVDANLHIWVDYWSDAVQAGPVAYFAPAIQMNRNAEWRNPDGQSEVGAEGTERFAGWVSWSRGNLTTEVRHKIKLKSQVEVQNRGGVSQVDLVIKERKTVTLMRGNQWLARAQAVLEAPLQVQTTTVNAAGGASLRQTRLVHQLMELVSLSEGQGATTTRELTDRQDAEGAEVPGGGWGSGRSRSSYRYKDGSRCYARNVNTVGGAVIQDKKGSCAAANIAMADDA